MKQWFSRHGMVAWRRILIPERWETNEVNPMLSRLTPLKVGPGHIQRERAQVECIQLLKLRSYSWESEEIRTAIVHSTEYQRGKSGTEITTDIYWVSLLSIQLSTDQCMHVHWSETTWGQRKKSPKRMRGYQCPVNNQG